MDLTRQELEAGGVLDMDTKVISTITSEYLDYDEVMEKFDAMMEWLCKVYVNTLNVIHYMHDKYCYEKIQMIRHVLPQLDYQFFHNITVLKKCVMLPLVAAKNKRLICP